MHVVPLLLKLPMATVGVLLKLAYPLVPKEVIMRVALVMEATMLVKLRVMALPLKLRRLTALGVLAFTGVNLLMCMFIML